MHGSFNFTVHCTFSRTRQHLARHAVRIARAKEAKLRETLSRRKGWASEQSDRLTLAIRHQSDSVFVWRDEHRSKKIKRVVFNVIIDFPNFQTRFHFLQQLFKNLTPHQSQRNKMMRMPFLSFSSTEKLARWGKKSILDDYFRAKLGFYSYIAKRRSQK